MNKVALTGRVHEIRSLAKCIYITLICRTRSHNEFLDIVLFDRHRAFAEQWINKGSWIAVDGHLSKSTRTDKDGVRRSELSIIADNIDMVGKPPETPSQAPQGNNGHITYTPPSERHTTGVQEVIDPFTGFEDIPLEEPDPDELPF